MEMRTTLSATFILALGTLVIPSATAQTMTPGTSDQTSTSSGGSSSSGAGALPSTTTGQSIAGQTSGGPSSSIATQTMPALVATTPPINPNPATAPLTNTPPQRTARLRNHGLMGTSNSFQNGINGTVQSNGVVNGTATMTPPPLAVPTPPARSSTSTNNGPRNAPGTVATPTPAAPSGQ